MEDYIKIEDLLIGRAYEVDGRNFSWALWDGDCFQGIRYKFGTHYISDELHWDADPHHGTVKPLRLLE